MKNLAVIKSGDIIEIQLEKNFGYGYVKVILTKDFSNFDYILLSPFNLFFTSRVTVFDSNLFQNAYPLTYYFKLLGWPKLNSKVGWYRLGNIPLKLNETIIPDFKDSPIFDYGNKKGKSIYLEKNFKITSTNIDFEETRNLGPAMLSSQNGINLRLTLFWMKILNQKLLDYYSEEELKSNFWINYSWEEASQIILYEKLPIEEWNKLKV